MTRMKFIAATLAAAALTLSVTSVRPSAYASFARWTSLQVPFYILAVEKLLPGTRVVNAFLDYVDAGRQVAVDPASVRSERFQKMLRELVDLVGRGVFVQEPAVCDWCDYTAVCGSKGLLAARRRYKLGDPELQRALHAKDLG